MENGNVEFLKNTEYKGIVCESTCDFSLPDYKGDVKRVLYSDVKVIPSGKFMDSGEISLSGIVVYNIIYLNSENKPEGVEFNSDYDLSYKCRLENATDFSADTKASSYSVRLTGPRRFNAKCSLCSDISVIDNCLLDVDYDIEMPDAEFKKVSAAVMNRRRYSLGEREYAEKLLTLDGVIADDVNIIFKNAKVNISSVSRSGDDAVIKGEIAVDLVLAHGEVPPYFERRSFEFEEAVAVDQSGEYAELAAIGKITSLAVSVNPEDFASDIVANVITELDVEGIENSEISLAQDGYCLYCACDPSYERLSYDEFEGSRSYDEKIEVRVPIETVGISSPREIIYTSAHVRSVSAGLDLNGAAVNAELRFSGVVCEATDNGEITYSGFKHSENIAVNVNLNCQNLSGLVLDPRISLSNIVSVIDKNTLVISCDAHIKMDLSRSMCISRLVSMNPLPDTVYEKCGSKITVYYPDSDEDVFAVAKKFRTTVKEIAVNNSLSEDVISPAEGIRRPLGRLIIK